ncbi:hydroxypyruvate isomerase family protein [Thermoactinospora rubra]|uniref:hydroxypyruvate isomerase family protein n=1 Tax=Thermoactinospora rubra TaxID=1088767 RepID=UPI000A0F79F1|nr:TIM barrel protein [Thermoactinospora rubra]
MEHPLPYAVNCSILFAELPLLARPAAARAAGFDAVEFWWPFETAVPADSDVDRFIRAIRDAGVELSGLNFAAGDMPGGDRGLVSLPDRQREFRYSVAIATEIGAQLDVPLYNALYGNRLPGTDPAEQDDVAMENLALAAQTVAGIGATVLVEPLSGAPRYPLTTAADAITVLDKVRTSTGVGNLGLLADFYHLTANGERADEVIATYGDRIGHVQIADCPGRNEPGTGAIDFDRLFHALVTAGYRGRIGLEYKPLTDTARAFDWLPREWRARGNPLHTSHDTLH